MPERIKAIPHRDDGVHLLSGLILLLLIAACAPISRLPAPDTDNLRAAQLSVGQKMYFRAWNTTSHAAPILLIHGIPDSSLSWEATAVALSATHPVYAVDLAGYGFSNWPEGYDLSLKAQAGYVRELINKLALRNLIVAGHDIGGGVAQLLAVQERTPVRDLILINSVIGTHWPAFEVRMLSLPVLGYGTFTLLEEPIWYYMLYKGFYDDSKLTAAVVAHYRGEYQGPAGRRRLVRNARALDNTDLGSLSNAITTLPTPTLILWAREDRFLDSSPAQRLCATLRDCRFAFIEHAGHFVPDEKPEEIARRILDFLRS